MEIKLQKPNQNLRGRLASDYYFYNESQYGKTIYRSLSLPKCKEGDVSSPLLLTLDQNYRRTSDMISEVYDEIFSNFIGFYADNGHLIAHTNIMFAPEVDGNLVAQVSEILIQMKEELSGQDQEGSLNWVLGIYREMIKYIEDLVGKTMPSVDRIDLIADVYDANIWEVTEYLGYDLDNSGDLDGNKCRFSKYVNERAQKYERRNTDQ